MYFYKSRTKSIKVNGKGLDYPEAEANSKEVVRTHLRPGPVSELLSIGHSEHIFVRSAVEGRTSTLQKGFLFT